MNVEEIPPPPRVSEWSAGLGERSVRAHLRALCEGLEIGPARLEDHVAGGKLLRARLVRLAAALGERPDEELVVRYAAFIELIHAGALLHDDVVDRSTVRRGRPTLWRETGVRSAALAGAGLMVRAGVEAADAPSWLRRVLADALREVARGQTDEIGHLFSTTVSPEAYLRRARAKTGALNALAARLGAAAGGLDAAATDAAARFAEALGLAFQLADDLRDLVGGEALGRTPGTDLRTGVLHPAHPSHYIGPLGRPRAHARAAGGERVAAQPRGVRRLAGRERRAGMHRGRGTRPAASSGRCARGSPTLDGTCADGDLRNRSPRDPALPDRRHLRQWKQLPPPQAAEAMPPFCLRPDLVITLNHPTIPARIARLTRGMRASTRVVDAVAAGATLTILAAEVGGRAEQTVLVGSIDLLVADFFSLLVPLSAPVAHTACEALADLLLTAARRAATAPHTPGVDDAMLAAFIDAVTRVAAEG